MVGHADLAFVGGGVYTVNAARRWAEAAAVRAGRIVAVGSDSEVRRLIGPGTEVIDLLGKMLLPGFQDAHVHASAGGLDRLLCDLSESHSRKKYLEVIREYAASHPEVPWVVGAGWSMDLFPGGVPSRLELDAVVPDRPTFIVNRDHHGAWVNSRALEAAGITRDTPNPPDGRIERDADGEPIGTLQEGAMELVRQLLPPRDLEERIQGVLAGQKYLHSLGITSWQEAIVGDYPGVPDCFDAYVTAADRQALSGRVIGALWWDRMSGEEQLESLVVRRRRGTVGRFQATTVKIMQDGVCENFTAAMLQPYLDREGYPTPNTGISYVDPSVLPDYVTSLDREGFQVHIHAIGDRAVREALDALEVARRRNGYNDLRHNIAHIQVVHPADIPRFRILNVVANAQPLWANLDPQMTELTLPYLGPERSAWQYPFGRLHRSGAVLAFGSDWPVSSPNPLWGIHVAVNRVAPPGWPYGGETEAEAFLPSEGLDLPTAIAAYTAGSAHVNHLDDTGSIEAGNLADMVVLDRNLFDGPPDEIANARVLLTVVGGEAVYVDPSLSSAG